MDNILKELIINGFKAKSIKDHDKEFIFISVPDKIIIIKLFEKGEDINTIIEDIAILSKQFKKGSIQGISDKDNEKDILELRKILWDIYIIGVHLVSDEEVNFKKEDISKIERNRLIARKIIIEDTDFENICTRILEILNPTEKLKSIINSNKGINEEELFNKLTEVSEGENLKNTELNSFKDLIDYLNKIEQEVKDIIIKNKGEESED